MIDVSGLKTEGMSFASMTSLALSSLLETCRKNGLIPTRDGFEFTAMVGPHISNSHKRKVHVTNAIGNIGSAIHVPPIPATVPAPVTPVQPQEVTTEIRQARSRLTELLRKKDIAEDNSDVLWSSSDETEYQQLYKLVYPEG